MSLNSHKSTLSSTPPQMAGQWGRYSPQYSRCNLYRLSDEQPWMRHSDGGHRTCPVPVRQLAVEMTVACRWTSPMLNFLLWTSVSMHVIGLGHLIVSAMLISHDTMFFSHNKTASTNNISHINDQANRVYDLMVPYAASPMLLLWWTLGAYGLMPLLLP